MTITQKLFDILMIILVIYFASNTIMLKLIINSKHENGRSEICVSSRTASIFSPIILCEDK